MTLLMFLGGLLCLLAGAQLLVTSASQLAIRYGVPSIFIGVTVVAFATSAPEVAVSVGAIIGGQSSGLALGNVIGSNIANILLILGLSAAVAPVEIKSRIVWLDIPVLIFSSLIVYLLALDNALQPIDGAILLVLFAAFMVFQIQQAKKDRSSSAEYEQESSRSALVQSGLLVGGLGLLVLGAYWLVESAITFARFWGLSELIIGLTIVAVGTSLPELATSVIAAWNKESDISVANVIGSNIFNVFLVLGITTIFATGGISVSTPALALDLLPFMVAVGFACLPIFFTGHKISRWEGFLFLAYYVAYLLYLFLYSTEHQLLPIFNKVMLIFALPVTIIGLAVSSYRYLAEK